ncbi:CHASE2 domain-containing protein [Hyphococcus luteus]|uniref:histidine kinase n=1 Tax=Hyphococcus luteus TaxID=2058213 RepID=A0A2S7K0G9_9PROT|nr:CHASE2 domain-containing protein [Marinicaulis flavus]PQA86013.1 hypothetical protein CW354_16670 [Marinicaulis flavus]
MPKTGGKTDKSIWRRPRRAAGSFVAPVGLFLVLLALAGFGLIEPMNNALMDARFQLIKREPTGTLVLVEIDPESIREEGRWPWPRERYARAVRNLEDAGASLIAFDIDFSSLSDLENDAAFAAALERRPGQVILPVFWQWSSRRGESAELLKTPPNEKFLKHSIVASVTLTAEKNGVLRRGWRAIEDDGVYRATLAGVLAGIPADQHDTFYIDFGIDADKIERLSFHDVLTGNFSSETVRGKNIMIGATALELGDEFAAPVLGVTSGVILHALSYESLVQNRALERTHPAISLALAALILIWLSRNAAERRVSKLVVQHAFLLAALIGVPLGVQAIAPVSFDVGFALAAQILAILYVAGALLNHRARQIISQRARTMRLQELAGIVIRDNADGVIVTDGSGAVELCNKRAKELLHIDRKTGHKIKITDLVPYFPSLASQGTGRQKIVQFEFKAPTNGAILEVTANRRIISAEKMQTSASLSASELVVYTIRDVSARKRIEEAEREAKEAAIAADKMKTQLISNMSHELRTPLNGVLGFAEILKTEAFGPHAAPEYKEFSQNIHESGERLLRIVNNMLNVAKLDAGDYELSKDYASIAELFEHMISGFQRHIKKQNTNVVMEVQDGMPDVLVDLNVMKHITAYLLGNALKFAGDGAQISLRAMMAGPDLLLEVEDNGPGVEPALLPRLTEVFFQGDSSLNRAHEGAGLGLYLASQFAALHDAVLDFESAPGKGFIARVRFAGLFADQSAPRPGSAGGGSDAQDKTAATG